MWDFREGYVEADGLRLRYVEAGHGPPLVWLHGAGGLQLKAGHHLLANWYRVIGLEMPGFGASPVNDRHQTAQQLAASLAQALRALSLDRCAVWGTSFGGRIALWLALEAPEALDKIILEAPIAILPEGFRPPADEPPEVFQRRFYAHPERLGSIQPPEPAIQQKQMALVNRLVGPRTRDAELERRMPEIQTPTLVLIGTRDGIVSPDWGRDYTRLLPNCNFMLVYDAAHEIAADRPEAFADTVRDFLQRGDGFVVSQRSTALWP